MAVSNFYGTNPLVAHSPNTGGLQQFRGFEREKHLDGHSLFVQDNRIAQVRAKTFIKCLERDLNLQEKNKSPLQVLLKQALQLPDSEENKQLLGELSQAFFKQRGYFSSLFSGESWQEWTENRTPLGKVASQFKDCIERSSLVDSFTKKLDAEVVRKANEEADALLKNLNHRDVAMERSFRIVSMHSCATGLIGGTLGSLLTQHPLPFLLGLSQCFLGVRAQQKVGNEFQVNNYTTDDQARPSVASFPNGNFVVTWHSYSQDISGWSVYGQIFNGIGTKIRNEFPVNTFTITDQAWPSVASFPNGNFVVTWHSYSQDGSVNGVYGQIFNGTGTKIRNEFQVNTFTVNDQSFPSVASFPNENFVVAWQSYGQDGSGDGIFGQVFNGTRTKIGNEFLVNTYASGDQQYPSVASLQDGNFVVSWESQDSSGLGVYGQLFNGSGNTVENEFRINLYALNSQMRPAVASLNNDNFVVTWTSAWQDGDVNGIYGQLFYGNGDRIGPEFQVNTYTTNNQAFPSVASLQDGNFVVAWKSENQDGSSWGVFGQLFDEIGVKIGNEFQVNTYTADEQREPSVAGLQDGNFVVTWHSNLQDGSGWGVYGQIFHDNFTLSSITSTTSTFQTTTTLSLVTSTLLSSSSTTRSTTSTTNRITTETIPVISDITSKIPSPSSNRNNRLFWLGFLFGGAGWVACLVQTGYFFYKSRRREEGGDAVELSEKANDPREDAGDYRYLGDLRRDSHQEEYANRPKSAPLGEGYGNVVDVEDSE